MGTGFMIDAPLRTAKYGISSVISLVDDVLIEQMRKYHCEQSGESYEEIPAQSEDSRARRITAYLDLLDRLIHRQVEQLQASPFEPGSEITRYFELLPDSPLSREYREMLGTTDPKQRAIRQDRLRGQAVPGGIDVNIMSKGDRDHFRNGERLPAKFSDASAAFRGYALSTLESSIVLSAGMNPRLYSYAAEFSDFVPDATGYLRKRIILKVSDYHSAAVQGKFLAKRGLWVSEYRIESGMNCGGHAFPTKGLLLGPILREFQDKKAELYDTLYAVYAKALAPRGLTPGPISVRITAQGGIGTAAEDQFLREFYGVDGTGWATPFLLVPEVTNVDCEHLQKLSDATDADVFLSDSSPFGLPFWNLRNSASELARQRRIAEGRPGSPCPKGYVKLFNTEFTSAPICTASRQYQKLKLEELKNSDRPEPQRAALRESVMAKSCICHDLAGGVTLKHGIDAVATPAVCCGPNIVNFSKIATLEEMVGHIYGRCSLFINPERPHMFVRELALYIEYLGQELTKCRLGLAANTASFYRGFMENLHCGIEYYRNAVAPLVDDVQHRFSKGLEAARQEVEQMLTVVDGLGLAEK